MTLATDTIERFTTITTALSPVTETPVTRDPTGEEAGRPGAHFDTLLYVVRTEETRDIEHVGTVRTVTAAPSTDGWFLQEPGGRLARVYGAVLNEPMVNGRHYRALNGTGLYVRYNDNDHTGDRNIGALPLSILASNGVTWPVPDDATAAPWDTVPYIEVEGPAAEPDAPAAEVMGAHQFVSDTSVNGPTRGFAEADDEGRVALNPAPEVGGFYLYWTTAGVWDRGRLTEAAMVTALAEDGTPTLSHVGYWTMELRNGTDVPAWYSARRSVLDAEGAKSWAKLALTVAEPTGTDASAWTQLAGKEAEEFRDFNDATNELAKDNDWCSEYEDIITSVGMEGRTKSLHDYDVEVTASIVFEADSVSSRIDGLVASDYDIPGISLNSARFRGDVTITIRVKDQEDSSDAGDYIDSDMIFEELNRMMSGVDDIEVDDWNVGTVRQVD